MSATNHLIEINPNNVVPPVQPAAVPGEPAVAGQPGPKTPTQAWQNVISKLPLSYYMAIIDGFHDFCKGGRVAGNVSNTTNDGEDDVDDNISDIVKKAYFRQAEKLLRVQLKGSSTQTPTDNINDMIAAMTNGKVGSMSNYERRTVKAIESRPELASVLGQTRKSHSIQEIVNAPNSDASENEDGRSGRPQLWKDICGEVLPEADDEPGSTYTKDDRNAAIAAGPALYDKSLYLYWDDDYQLPGQYWRQDKGGHNPLTQGYQAYEPIFLKRLGSFIYTYLYPELSWSDDDENKTAIVFDMASGCLGQIFGAFDNGFVTSDICPQTVSDSAGTSENQIKSIKKGSLNRYNFCETDSTENQINDAALKAIFEGKKVYKAQSNVLTWKYEIDETDDNRIIHTRIIYAIDGLDKYTQSTYCYFKVYICTRIQEGESFSDWELNELSFNIAEKNGPSVAYLSSLVYGLEDFPASPLPNPPLKKAMINITTVIQSMKDSRRYPLHFLQALLFDLKRCGDWEQSRSAQLQNSSQQQLESDNYKRVLFGTGDILCVTYNRECRGNSMWHYEGKGGAVAWNIELYRNPNITSKLDENISNALEVVRKSTTIEKMLDRICHSSNFMKRILEIKKLVGENGHKANYYYNGNKKASPNKIESKIEKLITMICRIGMKDIYYKCQVFESLLASPDNILKSIVGEDIPGEDVCETITNFYLMGLNYLRDIFTKMNVKSKETAIRFLMFVKAPSGPRAANEAYFTTPFMLDGPTVNTLIGGSSYIDTAFDRIITSKANPAELESLKNAANEETGIVSIILAKRIIFAKDYGGDDDDKFDEFLAIYEWLNAARQQSADQQSIDELVTKYANSINGASPESDLKKALDLLRDIKITTKQKILPAPGDEALSAVDPSGYKKKSISYVLNLGEVDPIFKLSDDTWAFNKVFGGSKTLGAFKFRITEMKKLADYLKLMYYKGFKIRARIGQRIVAGSREIGGTIYKPTDDWNMFSFKVKQTMRTDTNPDPRLFIGWTHEQTSGNSFRNYVSREVESAWPKLRKRNEDSEYGKILQDFTEFDCPALYRIVFDGTIARSYVMTENLNRTQGGMVLPARVEYCKSIFCNPSGKPIVEGLDISKLARKSYNLDQDGLTPPQKINIVAQEIGSFSRWLTILLDIGEDGTGLSPFSVNNLQNRAVFLEELYQNIARKASTGNEKEIDLINETGGLDQFPGDYNIERFINMMNIAVNSIKHMNTGYDVDMDGASDSDDEMIVHDDDFEGGSKIQKGGALPSIKVQKETQLRILTYLFLDISGKARALISPLTDPRQLLVILNNIPSPYTDELRTRVQAEVAAMNPQQPPPPNSKLILEILSLYSQMIYFNGLSGEDFDFLGTYKVFENIKYNFTASINSEMNPLTDEEGNPYDGYQFKLLDAVLKIFIMINNLHIRDATEGQDISTPPSIPRQQTVSAMVKTTSSVVRSIESGLKNIVDDIGNGDEDDDVGDVEIVEAKKQETSKGTKRSRQEVDMPSITPVKSSKMRRTSGHLDNIINNIDLLQGLNNSIISENETEEMKYYFDNDKVIYNQWLQTMGHEIRFNIQAQPQGDIQAELIRKLLYLILKSKIESGSIKSLENTGIIRRELIEILKFTVPYSQSIAPGEKSRYFILPHIKLLLAFSAIQSLLPAKTEERAKDPLFMLFFQNPSAIPSGQGIDFAWEKWQDNTIINSIYLILYKLLLFEEEGTYTRFENGGVLRGGKKNKTRKKRKRKRKTKKAKKKRQNKKRKTRVKRDKRKRRKTRGRKKKN